MTFSLRQFAATLLSSGAVLALTGQAKAQFPPPYPSPYGYGAYFQTPANGYLTGGASVIQAQGQFMQDKQQANILYQKSEQAKLDTQRKQFDQNMYEKSMTPTLEEERMRSQHQQVLRSLNNPPLTEILSGKSLNDLLPDIQGQLNDGIQGPAIALDQDMLRQINVTTGIGNQNIGLLKLGNQLVWPLGLRTLEPVEQSTKLRERIDALTAQARAQAASGVQVDAGTLVDLNKTLTNLQAMLKAEVVNMDPANYIESKRYLSDLSNASTALQMPTATNFVNGAYAARGKTVSELVRNMNQSGLKFAPAMPGETAAYVTLHNALVAYDEGTHKSSFRVASGSSMSSTRTSQPVPK